MRELREFRAHHEEFRSSGVGVAGVSLDPLERNRASAERLHLPFPLLSDPDRLAGNAFGLIRRVSLAGWNLEWFRRATILADRDGIVRAVWEKVRIRGHAREVLAAARSLAWMPGASGESSPPETPGAAAPG